MGASESHPETMADQPVLQRHTGMLQKESETLKTWNNRYAVLEKRVLSYWDTEALFRDGEQPRGRISLENTRVCMAPADDVEHPDSIMIETPVEAKRMAAQRSQTRTYWQAPTAEDTAEWLRVLRIASREPWASNEVAVCALCPAAFDGMMTRKHHCRRCGRVVCEACSKYRQVMPDFGYVDAVRVCSECHGQTGPLPPEADRHRAAAAAEETARAAKAEQLKRDGAARKDDAAARKAKLREQFIK